MGFFGFPPGASAPAGREEDHLLVWPPYNHSPFLLGFSFWELLFLHYVRSLTETAVWNVLLTPGTGIWQGNLEYALETGMVCPLDHSTVRLSLSDFYNCTVLQRFFLGNTHIFRGYKQEQINWKREAKQCWLNKHENDYNVYLQFWENCPED